MPVVTDYTALISGSSWSGIEVTGKPVIVTFSFPTSAEAYLAANPDLTPAAIASFQAFNAAEQAQARAAMAEWAAASGIVFVEVPPGQGDINFHKMDLSSTAYAAKGGVGYYPFGDHNVFTDPNFRDDIDGSGDVIMNSSFPLDYGTLLHRSAMPWASSIRRKP
jgi:hypothetical protein